jgi:hypothetical protein
MPAPRKKPMFALFVIAAIVVGVIAFDIHTHRKAVGRVAEGYYPSVDRPAPVDDPTYYASIR